MCQLIITGTSFVYNYFEKHRIFSFIDIVEPFLPIELQITLQIICVIKGIINLLYNKLKYRAIMKEMLLGMKSGITKMMKQVKALGEMETMQKCSVQRDEIIIPLHQK